MDIKRISTIALSNRDFRSLEEKLQEACRWVSLAAGDGSQLAVLPETLNMYKGDGPGNPEALTIGEAALDDWESSCAVLLDCAAKHGIAVTVPLYVRAGSGILNCFYLVSREGEVLGRYVKTYPTPGELEEGVLPGGDQQIIPWEGIRIGGGICFDLNFRTLFESQRSAGADIFLCPSLFPGGDQINYYALSLQRPFVIAYPAWSRIVDVLGREVAGGGYRQETLRFGFGAPIYSADVNFDREVFHADENQDKMLDILARYGKAVRMEFDQNNLRFALESLSTELSVADVAKEFGLVPIDQYMAQSRRLIEDAARTRKQTDGGIDK